MLLIYAMKIPSSIRVVFQYNLSFFPCFLGVFGTCYLTPHVCYFFLAFFFLFTPYIYSQSCFFHFYYNISSVHSVFIFMFRCCFGSFHSFQKGSFNYCVRKISRKTNILYLLKRTRSSLYRVRNVNFSENFAKVPIE